MTATAHEKERQTPQQWLSKHGSAVASVSGLLFCIIFFTITTGIKGESIWSASKLSTLIGDVIVTALMAVGAVFIYSLGNMDVSIGKQVGLYSTLLVLIGNATGNLLIAILVCVGTYCCQHLRFALYLVLKAIIVMEEQHLPEAFISANSYAPLVQRIQMLLVYTSSVGEMEYASLLIHRNRGNSSAMMTVEAAFACHRGGAKADLQVLAFHIRFLFAEKSFFQCRDIDPTILSVLIAHAGI